MPAYRMLRLYSLVFGALLVTFLLGYLLRGAIGAREGIALLLASALALRVAGRRT